MFYEKFGNKEVRRLANAAGYETYETFDIKQICLTDHTGVAPKPVQKLIPQQPPQNNGENFFTRLYRYLLREDIYFAAYQKLYANKGASGVDGVTVQELDEYMAQNWESNEARSVQKDSSSAKRNEKQIYCCCKQPHD